MANLENIKNIDKIKYTYWHKKIVIFLAEKYVSEEEREEVLNRVYYHDVDKLLLFPILDKEEVKKVH